MIRYGPIHHMIILFYLLVYETRDGNFGKYLRIIPFELYLTSDLSYKNALSSLNKIFTD